LETNRRIDPHVDSLEDDRLVSLLLPLFLPLKGVEEEENTIIKMDTFDSSLLAVGYLS